MRVKYRKGLLSVLAMMCVFCFSVAPVFAQPQGTDGTEMQVAQPEKLEIQLGIEWAGAEFQMKTDAGLYPDTILVGQDGVLRMEIGGSKSYILTCMNISGKTPFQTQISTAPESLSEGQSEETAIEEKDATVADIPIIHVCLFVGGMVLAVGGLVAMRIRKKCKEEKGDYEYDEDE